MTKHGNLCRPPAVLGINPPSLPDSSKRDWGTDSLPQRQLSLFQQSLMYPAFGTSSDSVQYKIMAATLRLTPAGKSKHPVQWINFLFDKYRRVHHIISPS